MWEADTIESSENHTRFVILEQNKPISHLRFLELLRDENPFCTFYNNYLKSLPFEAFFWENKPITTSKLKGPYECNIIKSDYLAQKSPDFQTFSSHFRKEKQVVSFPNLGNDAQLIAPCPVGEDKGYPHIGTFIREAPEPQVQQLWKQTAEEMLNQVGDEPRWLSTSGLGVFWLHIRIDSVPKYYQTKEYKLFD